MFGQEHVTRNQLRSLAIKLRFLFAIFAELAELFVWCVMQARRGNGAGMELELASWTRCERGYNFWVGMEVPGPVTKN